ncbi:MAG TPA: NAD(P)H-dependent oxidoreductase subunit E [Dehalococcoidia bacterium]|nr:NAD(P)H-dependent oxidoreductase subunit E [Dehalococcoidia bacterium]
MDQQILAHILEGRRSQPNQLIEVLQDVQEQYDYIPREAMQIVSRELGVPVIEVYRVASFYKAFRLKPAGKHILTFCSGTACHVRSSDLLVNQATRQLGIDSGEVTPDGLFSIEQVNCLGACALGPIVVENGSYHHHMTPARLRKLIESIYEKETALKEAEVKVYAEIE